MPTLILICGLPGAGKTTFAKRLEVERTALRLTPDDWMARLNIDLFDEPGRAAIEDLQWEIAARALVVIALGPPRNTTGRYAIRTETKARLPWQQLYDQGHRRPGRIPDQGRTREPGRQTLLSGSGWKRARLHRAKGFQLGWDLRDLARW